MQVVIRPNEWILILADGGIFVGGIVLGLLLGLIIAGVTHFVLYKQHKITWQQNKDKYGMVFLFFLFYHVLTVVSMNIIQS